MPSEQPDVIVAGGGPGGSTVAGRLCQKGHRVMLLEKEQFPRFHLGESLLPMTLEILDALGVTPKLDERLIRKNGAWFVNGQSGDAVSFKFAHALRGGRPYAFHGPRAEIDHVLLAHAEELGVEVRQGWEVTRLLKDGERAVGVVARAPDGQESELRASVVVDATGRDAFASRRPGAKTKTPHLEHTLAIFAHYEGCERMPADDEGDIRIVIVPDGWFWVIPFRGDITSVGIVLSPSALARNQVGSLDETLARVIERSPPMRSIMQRAKPLFSARAAADFSYRVPRPTGEGFLAVGDAAGFIDPLFSTGFHLAVKGGDLAAAAIDAALAKGDLSKSRFQSYEEMVKRAAETYIGVVQAFYDGTLVELLFDPNKRTLMRRMITSVLAGDVFHEEEPRWLREMARRFPSQLANLPGEDEAKDAPTPVV